MLSQGSGFPTMTPEHEAIYDVKARFVDALFAGDWDTMATLVHPDFELREPAALPYGGIYQGIEGFKQCWEAIQRAHQTTHLDTLAAYLAAEPDRIVVELDWRGTVHATGEHAASKVMEQFEFRDGKITVIALYWFNIPAYA